MLVSRRSRQSKPPPNGDNNSTKKPDNNGNGNRPGNHEGGGTDQSRSRWRDSSTYIAVGTIFLVAIGIGALWISRDTEIKQLSAFVTVNYLGHDDIHDDSGRIINSNYFPVVENTGETAIRSGVYHYGFDFWRGKDNLSAPEVPSNPKKFLPPDHFSLGPKEKTDSTFSVIGVDGGIVDEIRNRTAAMYVYGAAEYKDTFGYCHLTEFCFVVGRKTATEPHDKIPINFCSGGSNCTDEECADYKPC
jgi:hypothetical protein